jgi:hypothetical protein
MVRENLIRGSECRDGEGKMLRGLECRCREGALDCDGKLDTGREMKRW